MLQWRCEVKPQWRCELSRNGVIAGGWLVCVCPRGRVEFPEALSADTLSGPLVNLILLVVDGAFHWWRLWWALCGGIVHPVCAYFAPALGLLDDLTFPRRDLVLFLVGLV